MPCYKIVSKAARGSRKTVPSGPSDYRSILFNHNISFIHVLIYLVPVKRAFLSNRRACRHSISSSVNILTQRSTTTIPLIVFMHQICLAKATGTEATLCFKANLYQSLRLINCVFRHWTGLQRSETLILDNRKNKYVPTKCTDYRNTVPQTKSDST